jgi:hypothetical protein
VIALKCALIKLRKNVAPSAGLYYLYSTPFFMNRICCFLLVSAMPLSAWAQGSRLINPAQQHVDYAPTSYYISSVVDDRPAKEGIGTIKDSRKDQLTLPGGAATWLSNYISTSVVQKKSVRPVSLHILKLDLDIKQKGGIYQVASVFELAFFSGDTKIIGYTGKTQGETSKAPEAYVSEFINHYLESDLRKFDEWWSQNGDRIPAGSDVIVNVSIKRTADKPNIIAYTLGQPLKIADFQGPPEGAYRELAATYSGISLGYQERVEKGQTILDVTIGAHFNKATSWFKPEGKTPAVLAHEQTHFDITAIKACELAETIRKTRFTRDNYASEMERLHKESTAAVSAEEELYDSETAHGINKPQQAQWEKKISQQVREIGCYK